MITCQNAPPFSQPQDTFDESLLKYQKGLTVSSLFFEDAIGLMNRASFCIVVRFFVCNSSTTLFLSESMAWSHR